MSGKVETSQAEPDLTALEGFLVGNQDLERLAVSSAPIPCKGLASLYVLPPNLVNEEPTSGLEPLTCSLRVNCSYWTILCFTLLDNRRDQCERWSVMQCNERLGGSARPLQHLRGHRMVLVMATRTRGAKEYRLLEGSSEMASVTISRRRGVRGDRARLSSHLHLHAGLLR
jgi:hypothetical protein